MEKKVSYAAGAVAVGAPELMAAVKAAVKPAVGTVPWTVPVDFALQACEGAA